jgi:hypothetical protein
VQQAFFFTSLPGDITVYIERLRRQEGFPLRSRETGVIGLEYEYGANQQTLAEQHGALITVGKGGGQPRAVTLPTDWLNISDHIGYVVRRFPATPNVMRFHDQQGGTGRTPKLQEWLSLIGEEDPQAVPSDSDWACLVSFANQHRAQTRRQAGTVKLLVEGDTAICRIGKQEIRATLDFASDAAEGAAASKPAN